MLKTTHHHVQEEKPGLQPKLAHNKDECVNTEYAASSVKSLCTYLKENILCKLYNKEVFVQFLPCFSNCPLSLKHVCLEVSVLSLY